MKMAAALAAVAVVLAAPNDAQAGWRLDRAAAIARIVWHTPCTDRARIVQVAEQTTDGIADPVGCTVTLRAFPANRLILDPEGEWEGFCSLVIHEYGHLAGYRDPSNLLDGSHSGNWRSVMHSPILRNDPRCKARGRPFLEAHRIL
jgi:hypothetical protein